MTDNDSFNGGVNNNLYGNSFIPGEFNNKYNNTKIRKDRGSIALLIVSIIISLIGIAISSFMSIIGDGYRYAANQPNMYSYIGEHILVGIVILVILIFIAGAIFKTKRGIALIVMSIIYLISSISLAGAAYNKYVKVTQMDKAALMKLVSVYKDEVADKDISKQKYDISVYGELTPLLNLQRDGYTANKKTNANMKSETNALQLDGSQLIKTFSSEAGIENDQKKITAANKVLDKYETQYNDNMTNVYNKASDMRLPTKFKAGLLTGLKKSQLDTKEKLTSFFQDERGVLDKIKSLMNFMSLDKGEYIVNNNTVEFHSEDDVNKFNNYIKDIKSLSQQEDSINKDITDSDKEELDSLERLLR